MHFLSAQSMVDNQQRYEHIVTNRRLSRLIEIKLDMATGSCGQVHRQQSEQARELHDE
jgi:hypothetical protein